jgi:secreted Zn-dependent insulinase-like peptidase
VKTHSLETIKNDLTKASYKYGSDTNMPQILSNFNSVYKIDSPVVYRVNNDLKKEQNHFIANFYQIGVRDIRSHILTSLLELSWGKSIYHELRTVKQYGYIVNGKKSIYDNIMVIELIDIVLQNYCTRHKENT